VPVRRSLVLALSATLVALGLPAGAASAAGPAVGPAASPGVPSGGQPYREPVVLRSAGGVLEVILTAHEGAAPFDTTAAPAENALLFGYEILQGTASNGQTSGTDLYPAPTLNVFPGETLIVHLENAMTGLTIRDYADPTWTPVGERPPLYPPALTDSPYNNHVHGIHTSPSGNSDNVLIDIPAGSTNVYTYEIPEDHPEGLYWYHTHRHMLTNPQVYRGLAGMLVIGRVDGGIPAVAQNNLPVRTMALQYNFVFNRSGGQSVLNNAYWPSMLSTLKEPTDRELAQGTYRPLLTPVNFRDSAPGTTYVTEWWAGPLGVNNNRGMFQYMPSNLKAFRSKDGRVVQPANLGLPESQRDLQYTVNGQFQPVISTPPGQTEIWVLGNFTDAGYMRVAVQNTGTGQFVPLNVVGQDGNPYERVQPALLDNGTTILIPPASRYAIAVTMPQVGGLRLVMPPYTGSNPISTSNPGVLYTNDGTPNPPAVLGTIAVDPSTISYGDGFFMYPTQTLLNVEPSSGTGTTVAFSPGTALGAYTSFVDTSVMTPAVKRTLRIGGGFGNENASAESTAAFAYQFDGNQFPNIPLLQPRLNSVEEWTFVNRNNDQHPIHIHVNDYQVVDYYDPVSGLRLQNLPFGQDNQNTPAPKMVNGNVTEPGRMSVRTLFQDFIGTYVLHCHRLNHEDGGLMLLINVIPEVTGYAVAQTGEGDRPTRVTVIDQATGRRLARVEPFGASTRPVDVAMGDVNGDMILDLVVGAGPGGPPRVRAYSGAPDATGARFATPLVDTLAFAPSFRGGVSVATGNIDGTNDGDSIIVGSGSGMRATVKVLASGVDANTQKAFATWYPYGSFRGGVDVASGLTDFSGREVVVTAPGAGMAPLVQTFVFDLMHRNDERGTRHAGEVHGQMASSFLAFEESYRGGVNIATGWVAGEEGGFSRIIAGKSAGSSEVSVWTTGSRLEGHPELYVMPVTGHADMATYTQAARFEAFPGSTSGVDVTTAATPRGADLVVSGRSGQRAAVAAFDLRRPSIRATQWRAVQRYLLPTPLAASAVGGR
jgi:FtsP/CotA-like multicopper oxidase with cupredoxin domain